MGLSAGPNMKPYETDADRVFRRARTAGRVSLFGLAALCCSSAYLGFSMLAAEGDLSVFDGLWGFHPVAMVAVSIAFLLGAWAREGSALAEADRLRGTLLRRP